MPTKMPKRRLEYRGAYDIPTDAIQVYKPDTTTIEYPNLIYSSTNPLYGLFGSGIGYNMHGQLIDYNNGGVPVTEEQAKQKAKQYYRTPRERAVSAAKATLMDIGLDSYRTNKKYKDGGIYIKPSKRGTFTAAATKHGMGVQEFASKVLRNKEDYSPSLVKKANFARNASKWH